MKGTEFRNVFCIGGSKDLVDCSLKDFESVIWLIGWLGYWGLNAIPVQ